ncbi:sugar kinase [Microbacterium sp. A196]|uniref:sugar kinase n=1 Tax=Microbacterium sp. A196 TaxID=3457320 RepID=UPI003FD49864
MSLDVLTIGESLGLLVPARTGQLALTRDMRLGFGGAESNVAIGVARLGGRAAWCGRIGDDAIGSLITREIRAEGVEIAATVDPDAATALMLKERPRTGTTRIVYYRDGQAGSRLQPTDVPAGLVERARILHITGISAGLGPGPLKTVNAAIDRAKVAGVLVSFDVNHRSALWRDDRDHAEAYRALTSRADIVFAGEDEAALVTGVSDLDAQLHALRALGPTEVVIKRGAEGAVGITSMPDDDERIESAAIAVDVVDTVGAGDAFVAGWLTELARGASLQTRLATAIACGAIACTGEGDWETAPSRADLDELRMPGAEPVQR